jgi:hypothetical protein
MTSVKCPQCGLVYWSTTPNCKRCGLATAGEPADEQMYEQQAYPPGTSVSTQAQSNGFDEEQLLSNLKRDSRRFYFIGGLQIFAWFVIGNLLIVDAAFNIGLSFLAHKFHSRIASIALLVLTVLSVLIGVVALATGVMHFNPFVPLVLLGRLACSIRMVYTTFKLNAHAQVDVTRMMPPLPPVFQNEDGQWGQSMGAAQLQPE